jgi:hypothetical protein
MKLIFQTQELADIANRQIARDMGCDENTPYWYEVTEEVDGRYSIPCPDNLANLTDYEIQDDEQL